MGVLTVDGRQKPHYIPVQIIKRPHMPDAVTSPPTVPPSDADLEKLFQEIGSGNVVPIIGSDMIKVIQGKSSQGLMDYILEKLEEKYDRSKFEYDKYDCVTAAEKINRIHFIAKRDKLAFYSYIKDIMLVAEPLCDTSSIGELAKIRRFKLFVNASFTNVTANAVQISRAGITKKFDTWSLNITESPLQDIEITANPLFPVQSPKKLKRTVVYNLYGLYAWREDSFIVADDDILELVYCISSGRDKLKTLYELLSSSSLLFIGCNFPDWLLRMFIRMFSKQKLSVSNSLYSVADILNSKVDRTRAIFIHNSSIKYFDFSGEAFITKLFQVIQKKEPKWIRNNADANYVFLSYVTENQVRVLSIYDQLDDRDMDVYLDIRVIDHGTVIPDEVRTAITKCKVFIPIISNETATTASSGRFFRMEWDLALDLHQQNNPENRPDKRPVILPVFLDPVSQNNLKMTASGNVTIPDRFFDLKYQGASAESGLSKSFITTVENILDTIDSPCQPQQ